MADQSHLDEKYFIDESIYNCPFCKRRHVAYTNLGFSAFNWSTDRYCYAWRVRCDSCKKTSFHLTFTPIWVKSANGGATSEFIPGTKLDEEFFYSVPTSFFVLDDRIPAVIRDLVSEAEGARTMNFLTGASACTRKAIYELLVKEKATGSDYESRIKSLKDTHPNVDAELFDVLAHIQDMTSEKVHEQSWDKWESKHLGLILETLKTVLHELYVVPAERRNRIQAVHALKSEIQGKKPPTAAASSAADPEATA